MQSNEQWRSERRLAERRLGVVKMNSEHGNKPAAAAADNRFRGKCSRNPDPSTPGSEVPGNTETHVRKETKCEP